MKVRYFADTDTAHVQFGNHASSETREINENIYIDLDDNGNLVGMAIEHASIQATIAEFSLEQVGRKTG